MAQSVSGQIHVIQQDDSVVTGLQEEEGAAEQVILDIPVDMLPLEIQPQNLPAPKNKAVKIYRSDICEFYM